MEERKTYMEAIKSGKEMRKFVRIQVIGKDRVGKTSLVRRLLGQGIDDVGSTDGIEIARQCQIQTSDGEWIVSGGELIFSLHFIAPCDLSRLNTTGLVVLVFFQTRISLQLYVKILEF